MASKNGSTTISFENLPEEILQRLMPEQKKELSEVLSGPAMQKMMDSGNMPEIMKSSTEAFVKLYKEKCSIREAFGMSKDACEVVYACAYQKYSQGQYEECIPMFRLLCILESTEFKYAYGLAAAMHMQHELLQAASCYLYASRLDMTNPMPNFHAAECYLTLEDYVSAGVSLGIILANPQIDSKYTKIKEQAEIMNKGVQEKIKQQLQKIIDEHESAKAS